MGFSNGEGYVWRWLSSEIERLSKNLCCFLYCRSNESVYPSSSETQTQIFVKQ